MIKYLKSIGKTGNMAKKENTFLLLSLEEEKAKKLANVISSDVCRRILDYIANKDSTESEISKDLNIPISTIHYNLRQLVEAGLVKADEFHYSEKGKEVNHYSIANKYIIIAPKNTESISIKLKRILPVFLVVAATGAVIQLFFGGQGNIANVKDTVSQPMFEASKSFSVQGTAINQTQQAAESATLISGTNIALWFAIGALFALVVYLIYDILKERFK